MSRFNHLSERIQSFLSSLKRLAGPPSAQRPAYLRALSKMSESTATFLRRKPKSFYVRGGAILVTTYFLADLAAMGFEILLPDPAASGAKTSQNSSADFETGDRPFVTDYDPIIRRNLFSSKGLIPETNTEESGPTDGVPTRTTLPFELMGTIILENPLMSLATLQDKTAAQVYPVRVGDEVPTLARITMVEANRVTFVNLRNNRNEFVDIPEDPTAPAISFSTAGGSGPVKAVGENRFSIPRGEIEKTMQNLNAVLTQALARPVTENGQPAGFRLSQIVRGSIYDQLGLKDGDILKGFDNQPITDPMAAWEKLSDLKNMNQVEINVKRDGRDMTFTYDIF